MDAAIWYSLMYVGPIVSIVALFGIPIRLVQLFTGRIKRSYRGLLPWGKAVMGLAAISGLGVLATAVGAFWSLYAHLTCNVGGGCAQGEFSVAFSFGVLGLTYVVFELLLLPIVLPIARAPHAQPNP
jgi:hypothetical protein